MLNKSTFTKPHFINDKPDDYVCSIFEDMTVDLSFVKYSDMSLNIAVRETDEPKLSEEENEQKKKYGSFIYIDEYTKPFVYTARNTRIDKYFEKFTTQTYPSNNEYMDVINDIMSKNNTKINISLDRLITTTRWTYWETCTKFPVVHLEDKVDVMFMCGNMISGSVELYIKYREVYGKNYHNDTYTVYDFVNGMISPIIKPSEESIIKKMKETYGKKFIYNYTNDSFCSLDNNNDNKYDAIISDEYYVEDNLLYIETKNIHFFIKMLSLIMNNLKTGGNFTCLVYKSQTKIMMDLIFLICKCFNNSYMIKESRKINMSYRHIVCINKRPNEDLQKVKEFLQEIINTQKEIMKNRKDNACYTDHYNVYIGDKILYSAITTDNDYYQLMNKYQKIHMNMCYKHTEEQITFLENYKELENDKQKIMFLNNIISENIYMSKEWFKAYDVPISFLYEDDVVNSHIRDSIMSSKNINFLYAKKKDYEINSIHTYMELMNNVFGEYVKYQRVIDSYKNVDDWQAMNNKLVLHDSLKEVIPLYTNFEVSRAFLKMYEILHIYDFFEGINKVHSFHICEAPGQFIVSMNHYMKTKKKNIKWDWCAQSLVETNDNDALGDQYGIMKKYPNNWDNGEKKTGDITDIDNISYYVDKYKNINFITSDCGLGPRDGHLFRDVTMKKLTISEIYFLLKILNNGGSFVIKVFFPIKTKLGISLLYCLYKTFEEFHVYKPYINPNSIEVYYVGKNYIGKEEAKIYINKLYDVIKDIKNIDENYQLFKISKGFLMSHIEATTLVFENAKNHLKKVEYLQLFPDVLTKENYDALIKKTQDKWISNFDFKKINPSQVL